MGSSSRTMFITMMIWVSSMIFVTNFNFAEGYGVGWGRQQSQKLLPAMVVDILMSNGMDKAKLFSFNDAVLAAFSGSNISVTMHIPNVDMKLVNTSQKAKAWIKQNLTDFCTKNHVNVTHLLIGHEPLTKTKDRKSYLKDDGGSTSYAKDVVSALKFVQEAINQAKRYTTKVTVPVFTDVLKPDIKKPSEGDFRDDVKPEMLEILRYLESQGSPLNVNLYPHYSIREKSLPVEYGLFEEETDYYIEDGDNIYTNVFDELYDTFVWAMRNNGFHRIPITVGQVGWPTDGDVHANISIAERFYKGLMKKMRKNIGTPLQRGPLDVFLYNLVDENRRSMEIRGGGERHYGLYSYDGTPKFDIDFSGVEGVTRKLEPAQGVAHMPQRWCVLNPALLIRPDDEIVKFEYARACVTADCSPLMYGGSCNGLLDFRQNISYAFNGYFQTRGQKILDNACRFQGLGYVVEEDPSPKNGTCRFPLEIMSTLFIGGQGEMGYTLAGAAAAQNRLASASILLFIFFALLYQIVLFE